MKTLRRSSLVAFALVALSLLSAGRCEGYGTAGGSPGDARQVYEARRKVKPPRQKPAPPAPEPEPAPEPVPVPAPPPEPEPVPPPSATPAAFASRTTGVAPLGVYFDAVNTASPAFTSGVIQPSTADYGSFRYAWDFGDPNSGTWSTDGRTRNADSGFSAAHVYENPGTYTAYLTVIDNAGNTHAYSQAITVTEFSGATYYVSTSGSDSNNGLSTASPWKTFDKVVDEAGPNRRFLFQRGQIFSTSNEGHISTSGPGIIGAYGSGERPIIRTPSFGLVLSGSDWRVMDLEFDGGPSSGFGVGLEAHIQMRRATFLRVKSHDYYGALGWADYPTIYTTPHEEIVIADCELTNGGEYCAFVGGRRIAVIGNTMDTVTGFGHTLRLWQADKAVVTHNNLANGYHQVIKIHGQEWDDPRAKTRFVHISDNRLTGAIWTVGIGPMNNTSDDRVTQVVFERNWLATTADTQAGLLIWARDVTIRNNIFVANGVPGYLAVSVERRGIEPAATRVRVSNNTFYKGDSGSEFIAVYVADNVSNVTVRNNLMSAPSVGSDLMLVGSCPGLVVDTNLLSNSAGFTNAGAGNFTLTLSSPARNTGATLVDVRDDYTRTTLRPLGPAADLGAFERD